MIKLNRKAKSLKTQHQIETCLKKYSPQSVHHTSFQPKKHTMDAFSVSRHVLLAVIMSLVLFLRGFKLAVASRPSGSSAIFHTQSQHYLTAHAQCQFFYILSMTCAVLTICSSNCRFLVAIDCNDYNLSQID